MKNFCQTHRFYYEGVQCPYCSKDHFDKINNRKEKQVEKKQTGVKSKEREITNDDLMKLMAKFNNKNN